MHPCVPLARKKNNLKVNKINGFSKLHNFTWDDKGLRVWRAYDIGPGKLIPFDDVVVQHEEATGFIVQENGDFFTMRNARHLNVSTPEMDETECLNVQNLDVKSFSRASVSLKYMLKSEITEISPYPKAFTAA